MQVSRRQLLSPLGRTFGRRLYSYTPKQQNTTQVATILHNSLGVKLPHNRQPVILPRGVDLAFNDLLASLRVAIDSGYRNGVWNVLSDIRQAGHAGNLSLRDLEQVDEAIAPTIYRIITKDLPSILRNPPENRSYSYTPIRPAAPMHDMHELAIWLAVRGQICSLRASMILLLRKSKPKVVLDLWREYINRTLAGEGTSFLEAMSRPSSSDTIPTSNAPRPNTVQAETPMTSQDNLLKYHPGRPDLLTLTVCAHAMENDFRGAFDTVHATLIPLKPERALELLETVREIQEAAVAEALRYINDLDMLRMLSRPWSFRNHLFNLVEGRFQGSVLGCYQKIQKLLHEPDPWVGPLSPSPGFPTISPDPKNKPIFSLSRQTWCDLIEAADELRLPDMKQSIWKELDSLGVVPTLGMWNTSMLGYLRANNLTQARRIWDLLEGGRDVYTYITMIQGLFDMHLLSDALKVFEEMKKKISKEDISVEAYNIVIRGLFINNCPNAAFDLVSQLEANATSPPPSGPVPNISTYNSILKHHSNRRDMASVSEVLQTISKHRLVPDGYTLSTILNTLFAAGVKDAPRRMLEIMKALNVEVNEAIITELIEYVIYSVDGKKLKRRSNDYKSKKVDPRAMSRVSEDSQNDLPPRQRLQAGVKLLMSFEDAGIKTNEVNYTALMGAFHRAAGVGGGPPVISPTEAQQAVQLLRARMKERLLYPNRVTYHFLINACLEGGNVPPSEWRSIASQFKSQGDNDPMARPTVDMKDVPPNVVQAVKYFHEMRGADIIPAHSTWFTLLKGVASHGQIPLARALCNELALTGFVPQTGLLKLIMEIKGADL
ncbi:PPR containing plant-like protein [Ceratobasidium theobromae]|uniref:PPR containing plant-like protein n=1 Tax=Ceratobasidium theobromae TaxID=1582974 RepID=A0A5N5QLG2_9AGAM|nr:PPR containing plant-like protein [Ceratobasidium theobromae]